KKQQTRQAIFDSARRLFAGRRFEDVTVAEIARAANVSEVTVFNYFPTKEDLFYGGMQFFEEDLLEAVRTRPRGESTIQALRRRVRAGRKGPALAEDARVQIRRAFARLERGLGDYAVRPNPPASPRAGKS